MVFITGDCHGNFRRFGRRYFPEQEAILRDGTSYLCQIGKGGSSGCFRVSAGHIPGRHGFLPP